MSDRLPDPLTEHSLTALMRDPRYGQRGDPRFPALIAEGFRLLSPGNAQYDATGRMIRPPPRDGRLADLLRRTPDARVGGDGRLRDAPASTGDVDVDAYTQRRNGEDVQVAQHTRRRPGAGAAGEKSEASTPPLATPDKIDEARKATPYAGLSNECVELVKFAVPELGPTWNWKPGDAIKGPNDPPLEPGTPIATFDAQGRYPNKPTGNHAAIFLGYEDGGMRVLEQSNGKTPEERIIYFGRDPGRSPASNRGEAFSTILPREPWPKK